MKISGNNDFYAELRHEIRNNLTIISSRLQLLAAKYPLLKTDDIYLQLLEDLQAIHSVLNTYTSFEQTPRLLPCDIRQLLTELHQSVLPLFHQNGKQLQLLMPDSLPMIRADEQLLRQALINLIKNSAEATKAGQQVTIEASSNRQSLVITVTDNGTGIAPQQKKHIFEPFTSYKADGTGLGLYIVKSVVYAHHGRISCHSEEGKGSSFRIALPLPSASIQKNAQENADN